MVRMMIFCEESTGFPMVREKERSSKSRIMSQGQKAESIGGECHSRGYIPQYLNAVHSRRVNGTRAWDKFETVLIVHS
jgi:hypothetical protein